MRRLTEKERALAKLLLPLRPRIGPVFWYDLVQSTMDVAFQNGRKSALNRTLVVSEAQSRGRGRNGRRWYSSRDDLQFSILLTEYDFRVPYSMVGSYAVYRAFRRYADRVRLKWVNDVLWENGKKVAGVLTEEKGAQTAIGIGVNLNSAKVDMSLTNKATSYYLETGHRIQKELFIRDILLELVTLLEEAHGPGLASLLEGWERDSGLCGRYGIVESDGKRYGGTILGIERHTGALLIESDGTQRILYEGTLLFIE
jgi:BirA family biotin operon repressor/biotin-[acetyl-CoA-carboxylase] ligase